MTTPKCAYRKWLWFWIWPHNAKDIIKSDNVGSDSFNNGNLHELQIFFIKSWSQIILFSYESKKVFNSN